MNEAGRKSAGKLPVNSPDIKITICEGHVAVIERLDVIEAPTRAALRQQLEYTKRAFSFSENGILEEHRQIGAWELVGNNNLLFPAGFLQPVAKILRAAGYEVLVEDARPPAPQIDGQKVIEFDRCGQRLTAAIYRHHLGQMEARNLEAAIDAIALAAKAFPAACIRIAVATKAVAKNIRNGLWLKLGEAVGLAQSGARYTERRICVGTFLYMAGNFQWRRGRKSDMLFLPLAEEIRTNALRDTIMQLKPARVYAFVRPQRKPDRLLDVRLQQIAGQVIYRLAPRRVHVKVVFLPGPQCVVRRRATALQRKRTNFWRNPARNQQIAELAQAVRSDDARALRNLGLMKGDLTAVAASGVRVAVLVESLPHARALHAMLGDWPVQSTADGAAPAGNKANSIVTATYAAKHPITANVIICATGTEWLPRLKSFPPRVDRADSNEILIMDFADRFCRQATRDTERRAEAYRRAGYSVHMPVR